MLEPLPEKIQVDLNHLREQINARGADYFEIVDKLGLLCLNAYNLGKDPSYEVVPLD